MVAVTSTVPGNSAGPYTSPVDKLLLHTTEGGSVEGAIAAYQANNSWPHFTVDFRYGRPPRVVGHLDYRTQAARSLRNLAGGVQTNTDGVVQIEVVGSAVRPDEIDWAAVGSTVVAPICAELGIPVVSSVTWLPYPASYGNTAFRLSPVAWTAYKGVLGHQHAPENAHGDPGAIPIGVLLAAANQEDDMPYTPEELTTIVRDAVGAEFTQVGDATRTAVFDLARRGALYGARFLAIADDFVTGGTVYYTDLATKVGFPQGGAQHTQIKDDLAGQGLPTAARVLPAAVLAAIPDA